MSLRHSSTCMRAIKHACNSSRSVMSASSQSRRVGATHQPQNFAIMQVTPTLQKNQTPFFGTMPLPPPEVPDCKPTAGVDATRWNESN